MTDVATRQPDLRDSRACTRCDGIQQLVASGHGMGSYRCSTCTMHVGFDLDGDPVEFLLDRGTPARYTRDTFGERLMEDERRLTA